MGEIGSVLHRETKIPPYTKSRYYLDLRFGECHLCWKTIGNEAAITRRSIVEYEQSGAIPKGFLNLPKSRSLKIIEIAPGLAEFLPTFARSATIRPVAVDVIDYADVASFLEESLSRCNYEQRIEVENMIERAHAIMHLVDYIRCPVEMLEREHPELHGLFDMAVYNEGLIDSNNTAVALKSWLLNRRSPKQRLLKSLKV